MYIHEMKTITFEMKDTKGIKRKLQCKQYTSGKCTFSIYKKENTKTKKASTVSKPRKKKNKNTTNNSQNVLND